MSKPKIYARCDAGCKWEVSHKTEIVSATAYYSNIISTAILMIADDRLTDNTFVEVFGTTQYARDYLRENLQTDKLAICEDGVLTMYVEQNEPSEPEMLQFILKITYADSSFVYIHF